MASIKTLMTRMYRAFRRVFPQCQIVAEATAYNMFLAFFPILLLGLGLLHGTKWGASAVLQMWFRLQIILPPESSHLVGAYLGRHGESALRWILVGFFGTLLVGARLMTTLTEGFHIVAGDETRPKVWNRQLRVLILLCLTIFPWLAVVILTIFGRQFTAWLMYETGSSFAMRLALRTGYVIAVFVLGVAILMTVYRVGRPGHRSWRDVLHGAVLATILWWAVDYVFGTYVRHMPYDVVYGGVAAAIGLLIWMYLTTVVVLLGAAYNAELRAEESRFVQIPRD